MLATHEQNVHAVTITPAQENFLNPVCAGINPEVRNN
jgi:hypothetical protein